MEAFPTNTTSNKFRRDLGRDLVHDRLDDLQKGMGGQQEARGTVAVHGVGHPEESGPGRSGGHPESEGSLSELRNNSFPSAENGGQELKNC